MKNVIDLLVVTNGIGWGILIVTIIWNYLNRHDLNYEKRQNAKHLEQINDLQTLLSAGYTLRKNLDGYQQIGCIYFANDGWQGNFTEAVQRAKLQKQIENLKLDCKVEDLEIQETQYISRWNED